MTALTDSFRAQALELPEGDRARLAHDLIASLDGPAVQGAAMAWDREILRRMAEIDAGDAELITPQELEKRVQAQEATPAARLADIPPRGFKLGILDGQVGTAPDFLEPMPPEDLAAWEGTSAGSHKKS